MNEKKSMFPNKNIAWICGTIIVVALVILYVVSRPQMTQEQREAVANCIQSGGYPNGAGHPVMDKTGTIMVDCY